MLQWFYSQYGQTKGPVSESALLDLILKEELALEDYVMNDKDELWKKIKDIQPLLDKIHEPEKAIPHNVKFGADFLENSGEVRVGNLYFFIPLQRLFIMTILSGGLYQIYWFYKQWSYWAFKHKQSHRSFDREAGWLFFPLRLFEKIETDKELNAVARSDFNGTMQFWLWLLIGGALGGLQFAASRVGILYYLLAIIGWTAGIFFLIPIQRYINRVNEKLGNTYDKLGFGHYACIAAGIALMVYTFSLGQIWRLFQA